MKAIAIDDEPIALDIIKNHSAKVPFLQLKASFTDAFQALQYLQNEPVDLMFLDIKMPDISGIEFFSSLSKKPMVIFTTAYSEHAVTSFELDAIDYLLKPFSLARFVKACNKAFELYSLRNATDIISDHVFVKTGYEQVKILFTDILYLEASGNYVTFVLKDKNILSRITLAEAINLLPQNKFIRVHRSFIVSLSKIDKVEKNQLTITGRTVPISDAYVSDIIEALKK